MDKIISRFDDMKGEVAANFLDASPQKNAESAIKEIEKLVADAAAKLRAELKKVVDKRDSATVDVAIKLLTRLNQGKLVQQVYESSTDT